MADNYKFVITGNDKTRAMFKGLKANLGAVRGAINSTGTQVAALAGVAGLGALVKSSLSTQDALAKTADRLGLTTRQLAAYQHQANLTGSSNDGMTKALELMNRNLGAAERGTGTAKKALEDLGLSVAALNQMPTVERFELLVSRLDQVGDRTLQASLAADIFGRSGTQMLNLIDQGAAGLAQAKTEVDAYGVALSRVDAAKLEAANDAMFRVQQIGQGLGNQLAVHLAPVIEEVAVQFANAASAGGGMGAMVESAFRKGVTVAGVFADGVRGIHVILKGAEVIARGFGAAVVGAFNLIIEGAFTFANHIKNLVLAPLRLVLQGASVFSEDAAAALASLNATAADFQPPAALGQAFNTMVDGLRQSREELQALLMQQIPSEALQGKVDEILAAAEVRAQAIAASAQAKAGLPGFAANDEGGGSGIGADGLSDQEREQLAAKLETLKLSWLTELEQLQVKQDEEMALLDAGFAEKLLSHEDYERQLTLLEAKHTKDRAKLEAASSKSRWQSMAGAFQQMLGVADGGSKKLFKIQKSLALARAVVTLPSAVIESFNNSGGYPWGIPAAAAMAATGAAQIAQIKSGSFSGGGGGVGGISGGSSAAEPPSGGASLAGLSQFNNNQAQAPGAQVSITIAGDLIGDNAQTIARQLQTLMEEQDVVLFSNTSRQAAELTG